MLFREIKSEVGKQHGCAAAVACSLELRGRAEPSQTCNHGVDIFICPSQPVVLVVHIKCKASQMYISPGFVKDHDGCEHN